MSKLFKGLYLDHTTGNGEEIEIDFTKLKPETLQALNDRVVRS